MARRLLISSVAAAAVGGVAVALRRIAREGASLPDLPATSPPPRPGPSPAVQPAASPRRGPTRTELYAEAKRLGIEGRSRMSKAQLQQAVAERRAAGRVPS